MKPLTTPKAIIISGIFIAISIVVLSLYLESKPKYSILGSQATDQEGNVYRFYRYSKYIEGYSEYSEGYWIRQNDGEKFDKLP